MSEVVQEIGAYDLEQLESEISALAIAGYSVTVVVDDTAKAIFDGDITAQDEQAVRDVILAHVPTLTMKDLLMSAKVFGVDLMDKYAIIIMSDGLVGSGQEHSVGVALSSASILAQTGNLHGLDAELSTLTPIAIYLEQDRINAIRNEIRAYLGLAPI